MPSQLCLLMFLKGNKVLCPVSLDSINTMQSIKVTVILRQIWGQP